MSTQAQHSQKIGDLVVISITGCVGRYIAEVIHETPLGLKVEEHGPYARLRYGDFIINSRDSAALQGDDEESTALLKEAVDRNHPFISGLERLGVTDGKLHQILPS